MSMADRIAVMQHGRVDQIDAPVELYERPKTLFVAGFIGLNNLFTGSVAAGGLDVPGLGLLPARDAGLPGGSPARLAIRPEHIRVAEGDAVLAGTVIDTQFYGGMSTIAVAVKGYDAPVLVTQQGATRIARDTSVRLTWEPGRAVLLAT